MNLNIEEASRKLAPTTVFFHRLYYHVGPGGRNIIGEDINES